MQTRSHLPVPASRRRVSPSSRPTRQGLRPGRARWVLLAALGAASLCAGCAATGTRPDARAEASVPSESSARPYVFAWPDYPEPSVSLRGGTTTGAPVSLAREPDPAWTALQASGRSAPERDRAAIRALAGDYRVQFDFLETIVFQGDRPAQPYRSWGTERVYLLRDEPGFVSLQHILVMYVVDEQGETQGPFVQKHWRQDWRYEPERIFVYDGHGQWSWESIAVSEAEGRWSQTVYQVDDTPRYTLLGSWAHRPEQSVWTSGERWRPLPRRERTVRDDYDVLEGTNRITVQPTGWVHEQDNLKLAIDRPGRPAQGERPVAREIGVARYERLDAFDFSAGDLYWERTRGYWRIVREAWSERLRDGSAVEIAQKCGDEPLFSLLFGLAMQVEEGRGGDEDSLRRDVEEQLDCVVNEAGASSAGASDRADGASESY